MLSEADAATSRRRERAVRLGDAPNPSPEQLIIKIAEGDRASFVALFVMFAPKVKSYLLRLKVPAETADDLTQEVMLKVWRRAGEYDERRGSLAGWLFTIVRNTRIDAIRREHHPDELAGSLHEYSPPTPEQLCLVRERGAQLKAAMTQLSPAQSAVFRTSLMRDGTLAEVARALGFTLATTKSHLHRAMARLREAMEAER